MKFKGNFGDLTLNINGTEATGTSQENGTLKGEFINNTFKGQWENKGMKGLVEFTITDNKLEGNWKKGLEPGPMKGKWEGNQILEKTKTSYELNSLKQIPLELNEITESLKNNFLFQVSLGSKELFHSNLLAWLLEQKNNSGEYEALSIFIKTVAKKDVAIITEENTPEIAREENKIDLTIKWKEAGKWNLIFIENKMKSIPTSEQLNEYDKKTDKLHDTTNRNGLQRKIIKKFLLTPFKSDVNLDSKKWDNITYQEDIITFLETIKALSFVNDDVKYAIEKYISFLNNQNKLLLWFNFNNTEEFKLRNYDFYISKEMDEVKNLRLHDLMLKNMHERLRFLLNEKLNDSYIEIKTNFTRGTGITDIFYDLVGTDFKIGMQIQGNSLKHCMFSKNLKSNSKNIEYCKKIIKNKLWFYDYTKNPLEILSGKGQNPSLKIEDTNETLCEYSNGHFLYLSKSLDEFESKSIDSLIDYIFNEYRCLIENKDKILEIVK